MYAELHCRSYFSFLAGASPPEALIDRAAELGYAALALTDLDGVHGLARAHLHARERGLRLAVGAELTVADDLTPPGAAARIVLLPRTHRGYANLCLLITRGRTRCAKGSAFVTWDEVSAHAGDLVALSGGAGGPIDAAWRRRDLAAALEWAGRLGAAFPGRAYLELTHHLAPGDDDRVRDLAQLARTARLPPVITQDARFATPGERPLHDVQTAIREKTPLAAAGRRLAHNGERSLHPVRELERRFAGHRAALARTAELAQSLAFSLDELRFRFPAFDLPAGETPLSRLSHLAREGARARYRPLSPRAAAQIAHELSVIQKLDLAGYFLIVWDIVRFCRERGILCQGRGSAANSAVCYALGITAVDPVGMELLFERFLSEERDEMPDIDLDIDSDRREEVIQYVYRRFGRERVAMTANVITYHARSAVRDVGKAFGLSQAQVDRAARSLDRYSLDPRDHPVYSELRPDQELIRQAGLDPRDPVVARVFELARAFEGFPRHLGIHSGGMVITAGPTHEVVPVENATMEQRTVVQWDKDDLSALGIIKIDLLGLGMLTAIDETVRLLERHQGERIDLAQLPADDPSVYDMICRADTVGVFQIESRAQMSMLPRLKPRTFYDLVVQVAIIRPGPIQGEMIHPYLRRRDRLEPVTFEHPALEPALGRTLGVPLFQEQGMKVAVAVAGFTAAEADELRRAMGHKRSHAKMAALSERLLRGMEENGVAPEVARRIYKQLCAFADYGFPESHAASFALIVYASSYLKRYHPAAFLAGLLNAQPMGFYSRNTLIADARRHQVEVLPPCAIRSEWKTTLEEAATGGPLAVRLGMREVSGLGERHRARFEAERARAPFTSIADLAHRARFPRPVLARLASGGGLAAFAADRRQALWEVAALPPDLGDRPLLDRLEDPPGGEVALPPMSRRDRLRADFDALGLSIEDHPVALVRARLAREGIPTAAELARAGRDGERRTVAGMVITRQRPGSANGMTFMTLEDETGFVNLVLTPPVFEKNRRIARSALLVRARGRLERKGRVQNLVVDSMESLHLDEDAPLPSARDFR